MRTKTLMFTDDTNAKEALEFLKRIAHKYGEVKKINRYIGEPEEVTAYFLTIAIDKEPEIIDEMVGRK